MTCRISRFQDGISNRSSAILFTNKCMSTADLTALDSQWKYALHYNCIRIHNDKL